MSMNSMMAAQDCRDHLEISSDTYATVTGYVGGKAHNISVLIDHNKVEFSFDEPIGVFQHFTTEYQDMVWDEADKTLMISNKKPLYSFKVFFPNP